MDIKQAFQVAQQGRRVRRSCWSRGIYAGVDRSSVYWTNDAMGTPPMKTGLHVELEDLLAEDWEPEIDYTTQEPVYQRADGTWWFWDETWAFDHGPYATEEKARERLKDYGAYLDTGVDPGKD